MSSRAKTTMRGDASSCAGAGVRALGRPTGAHQRSGTAAATTRRRRRPAASAAAILAVAVTLAALVIGGPAPVAGERLRRRHARHHHHQHEHHQGHHHAAAAKRLPSVVPAAADQIRFRETLSTPLQQRASQKEARQLRNTLSGASRAYGGAEPQLVTSLLQLREEPAATPPPADGDDAPAPAEEPQDAAASPDAASGPAEAASGPAPEEEAAPEESPDDVRIQGAKDKIAVLEAACEKAKELLANATADWEESKNAVVAELAAAHGAIRDAHDDAVAQGGGATVADQLEDALKSTRTSLMLRPKTASLRRVKDSVAASTNQSCSAAAAARDELEVIYAEITKRQLARFSSIKKHMVIVQSELGKHLAAAARVSRQAQLAEKTGADEASVTAALAASNAQTQAGIHTRAYLDALTGRRAEILSKLNRYLADAGKPPVQDPDSAPQASPAAAEKGPSWGTPQLDSLQDRAQAAGAEADAAVQSLGGAAAADADSEATAEAGDAAEPATKGAASEEAAAAANATAEEEASLTPAQRLEKRLEKISQLAKAVLGNSTEDGDDSDGGKTLPGAAAESAASEAPQAPLGVEPAGSTASDAPGEHSQTRTFVSGGATTTVTTMYHPKEQHEEEAKVWKQVKDLEEASGSGAATGSATGAATGGAATGSAGPTEKPEKTDLEKRIEAVEAEAEAEQKGAEKPSAQEPSPLEKRMSAIEQELGISQAPAGPTEESKDSVEAGEHAGAGVDAKANATAPVPAVGMDTVTMLRTIAQRMAGSNELPGDDSPYKDAKTIDQIASKIKPEDLKDADLLRDIAQRLSGADATTGLEASGKDESEDAKLLQQIAKSLVKLAGGGSNATAGAGSEEEQVIKEEQAAENAAPKSGEKPSTEAEAEAAGPSEGSEQKVKDEAAAKANATDASGDSADEAEADESDPNSIVSLKKRIDELESVLSASGPAEGGSGASGASGAGDEDEESDESESGDAKEEEAGPKEESNADASKDAEKKDDGGDASGDSAKGADGAEEGDKKEEEGADGEKSVDDGKDAVEKATDKDGAQKGDKVAPMIGPLATAGDCEEGDSLCEEEKKARWVRPTSVKKGELDDKPDQPSPPEFRPVKVFTEQPNPTSNPVSTATGETKMPEIVDSVRS